MRGVVHNKRSLVWLRCAATVAPLVLVEIHFYKENLDHVVMLLSKIAYRSGTIGTLIIYYFTTGLLH